MDYDAYTEFRRYLEDFEYIQKKVDSVIKDWKDNVFPELEKHKNFLFVEDNDYTIVLQCYREKFLIDFAFEYLVKTDGEKTNTNIVSKIRFFKCSKNIVDDNPAIYQIGQVVFYDQNGKIFSENGNPLFPYSNMPASRGNFKMRFEPSKMNKYAILLN